MPESQPTSGDYGWFETNDELALRDDRLERLSARTTVVTHFHNVEYDSRFALIKNGELRVAFDPFDPGDRTGSQPDALLAVMRAAGFTPDDQDSDNLRAILPQCVTCSRPPTYRGLDARSVG